MRIRRRPSSGPSRRRPALEGLEPRTVLSTLIFNPPNTNNLDWDNAQNWSVIGFPNAHFLPTAMDDVEIPAGFGAVTHVQGNADTVHSILELASPLDIGAGSITVSGNSTIGDTITVESGAALTITNATVGTSSSATIADNGTVTLNNSTLGPGVAPSATAIHVLDLLGNDTIQGDLTIPAGATVTETTDNTTLTVEGNVQTSATNVVLGGPGSSIKATGSYTAVAGQTDLNGGTLAAGVVLPAFVGPVAASNSAEVLFEEASSLDAGGGTVGAPLLEVAGTLAPSGTVTVTGNYQQDATGALTANIGGTTPGTGFDQVTVDGAATLGGTLDAAVVNGFAPTTADSFVLVQAAGGVSGRFATTNFQPAPGTDFVLQYTPTEAVLDVTTSPPAGDITSSVAVHRGGFLYDRAARQFVEAVTITNTSSAALSTPLYFAMAGLPSGVAVVDPTGTAPDFGTANDPVPAGTPYLRLASGLGAGQSVTFYVRFDDLSHVQIAYTPVVLQGADPGSVP